MRGSFGPSAKAAAREGRAPDFVELLRRWGGATIAYRRRLIDAPSYTLNHEEVAKALEEGISFAERLTPEEALLDRFGWVRALRVSSLAEADSNPGAPPREFVIPARTILVAAGTQPNTVLGREDPDHVLIDGKYFQAFDESGSKVTPERVAKPAGRARADVRCARRPRDQLLRRSASVVCRQCRQGDGERQAGLSGGQPDAGADGVLRMSRRTR